MPTAATTHSTEPGALRWYRWLVWAGIVSNIIVCYDQHHISGRGAGLRRGRPGDAADLAALWR